MTVQEIEARIRWLNEMLKLLQQQKPKPTGPQPTRH